MRSATVPVGGPFGDRLRLDDARPGIGVRREPVGNAPLAQGVEARQRLQEARHAGRIPAGLGGVLDAQPVGLELVVAAVLEEERAEAGVGQIAERGHAGHEDAGQQHAERAAGRARVLLRHVAGGDVAHLVAEHAGELGLVAQVREQPARDVDEAAGQRERVHGRRVDHGEGPRQVRTVRDGGDPFADAGHVALQLVVVVDAHLATDLGVATAADLDLLGLADEGDLALTGDRVGRAGGGEQGAAERRVRRPVREGAGPMTASCVAS